MWFEEGKSHRGISKRIRRITSESITHVAVGNFSRKLRRLTKGTQRAIRLRIRGTEEALAYMDQVLDYLEGKEELSSGEKLLMSERGSWSPSRGRHTASTSWG
jgi:hypothetical protein